MRALLGFGLVVAFVGCAGGTPGAPGLGSEPIVARDDAGRRDVLAGARWRKLPAAPAINGKQDDLYFVDAARGFSVNGEGRIFRTDDGGESFRVLVEQPGTFFRSIMMVSESRGFAGNIGPGHFPGVTDTEPLYETRDGGETWAPVTAITGPRATGVCNMHRLDDQHLFAVGRVSGPCHLLSSSDGGESWTSRDLSAHLAMLIDVRFTTPTDGMVVGMNGAQRCAILRTADGGDTWREVFTSVAGSLCWKIAFPSANVGYVSIQGGASSTFAKTVDGGETWVEKPLVPGPFNGLGAGFLTEDVGWIAGPRMAYRTLDGGETWELDDSLGPAINRFRFVDARTAYAIGTTIYKLELPAR